MGQKDVSEQSKKENVMTAPLEATGTNNRSIFKESEAEREFPAVKQQSLQVRPHCAIW